MASLTLLWLAARLRGEIHIFYASVESTTIVLRKIWSRRSVHCIPIARGCSSRTPFVALNYNAVDKNAFAFGSAIMDPGEGIVPSSPIGGSMIVLSGVEKKFYRSLFESSLDPGSSVITGANAANILKNSSLSRSVL